MNPVEETWEDLHVRKEKLLEKAGPTTTLGVDSINIHFWYS